MESYRIVSDLTEQQISELTDLYRNEFWSQNRTQQDVAKMLTASDIIIGLVDECDRSVKVVVDRRSLISLDSSRQFASLK